MNKEILSIHPPRLRWLTQPWFARSSMRHRKFIKDMNKCAGVNSELMSKDNSNSEVLKLLRKGLAL